MSDGKTVAIIGAGPVGLAAAAHVLERGMSPIVLEAGPEAGHAVRQWQQVQLFSPWEYNVDKAAARRKLVISTAAKSLRGVGTAQQPNGLRARLFVREVSQIGQRAHGGMPGAEHGNSLRGISGTRGTSDIRHAVGNAIGAVTFADRRQAVVAGRIGGEPCLSLIHI